MSFASKAVGPRFLASSGRRSMMARRTRHYQRSIRMRTESNAKSTHMGIAGNGDNLWNKDVGNLLNSDHLLHDIELRDHVQTNIRVLKEKSRINVKNRNNSSKRTSSLSNRTKTGTRCSIVLSFPSTGASSMTTDARAVRTYGDLKHV